MKTIQFFLVLSLTIAAVALLVVAIVTPSVMRGLSIFIFSLITSGCYLALRISYKEMKDENERY